MFVRDGQFFRQVNPAYREHYDHLMNSGLYAALSDSRLLLPHEEVSPDLAGAEGAYKVLRPLNVPFISYPYEWCFSQLKDAALATLAVQKKAFEFGMVLKDSSAYNIQFVKGKPVLIDTLSFERYHEGRPWVAYRQFCQHFLAPLALMSCTDVRLNQLLRVYIDGVPLDIASGLLPLSSRLRFSLLCHIHLHARSQRHYADKVVNTGGRKMGRMAFQGLIEGLESAVKRLKWQPAGTEWAEYYDDTNYTKDAFEAKRELVARFLVEVNPAVVWDLGANTGVFSRIASNSGIPTMSFDVDAAAVESNYRQCREEGEENILPLLMDLTNPSPGIGWENKERMSVWERGPADMVLALALIHHLAISNNLPFARIARCFQATCNWLIIEFVPKSDSKVQILLATRADIFPEYTEQAFEREFSQCFEIVESAKIPNSERTVYLMRRRDQ